MDEPTTEPGASRDEPGPPREGHVARERRGVWVSAAVSGGLFSLPWVMALVVGVYADFQPAADLAVELYQPLEPVVLQLDPPNTEERDIPDPEPDEEPPEQPEPVEETDEDGLEEEVPPEDLGEEEGADDAIDSVDEEPAGDDEPQGGTELEGIETDDGEPEGKEDEAPGNSMGRGRALWLRRAKKGWKSQCKVPHPNIRKGDDGIMEIDRSLVDYYTSSLKRFMELGYSEPFKRDGVKGFYIGGFGCRSPVHKAGLRRGDVVLTVNGRKTRTWIGVYLMYKKLKNKDHFEVVVLRKGEEAPRTLHFRVVDS